MADLVNSSRDTCRLKPFDLATSATALSQGGYRLDIRLKPFDLATSATSATDAMARPMCEKVNRLKPFDLATSATAAEVTSHNPATAASNRLISRRLRLIASKDFGSFRVPPQTV